MSSFLHRARHLNTATRRSSMNLKLEECGLTHCTRRALSWTTRACGMTAKLWLSVWLQTTARSWSCCSLHLFPAGFDGKAWGWLQQKMNKHIAACIEFILKHLRYSRSKMADNVETIKLLDVCRLQQKVVRWLADVCEHFKWCFSLLSYKPQCTRKEADRAFKSYMSLLFFLAINWTICFANFISSPLKL